MKNENKALLLVCLAGLMTLTACDGDDGATGPEGPAGPAGEPGNDAVQQSIALTFLGRARNPDSGFDEGAAEIISYEPASQQLFVVNA